MSSIIDYKILIVFVCVAQINTMLLNAQESTFKSMVATRISQPPAIDGLLNDSSWKNLPIATGFIQFEPYNGLPSNDSTLAMIGYDDEAFYMGAMVYEKPENILLGLGDRDNWWVNSDRVGVWLLPFNDGYNGFEFWVTASGVQIDAKRTGDRSDNNWDEVWQSEVALLDSGWSVEIRIPYSALRFPATSVQTWGLNIWKENKRTGESSSWNYIDRELPGMTRQSGTLKDIKDIKPPLRLTFTPYVSGYYGKYTDNNPSYTYKGGLDVKYGINESYTLDMMLIPDFGQVQSDDQVLNLSPFEVRYAERRTFFTEGSELFDKANIFYSKRIGGEPSRAGEVEDVIADSEKIKINPQTTQLINATKFSGRNDIGIGIGMINAISSAAFATVEDTITGEKREVLTQPITNYNVAVIDKTLRNNSFISIINTNYFNDWIFSDVIATETSLKNKKNTHEIDFTGVVSNRKEEGQDFEHGYRYDVSFGKISGKYRYRISRLEMNDTYEINDLGFLNRNNLIRNSFDLDYRDLDPVWIIQKRIYSFDVDVSQQYKPRKFGELAGSLSAYAQFMNFSYLRASIWYKPIKENNFFEARVDDRIFVEPPSMNLWAMYSTDTRKDYVLWTRLSRWLTLREGQSNIAFALNQGYNISSKAGVNYGFSIVSVNDNRSFANKENNDSIIFGARDQTIIENTVNFGYSFSNKATASFRLRHYWSEVLYERYFELNQIGLLNPIPEYTDNHDVNYNAFTIDLVYSWRFAPGSEMRLVWKNEINKRSEDTFYENYFENFYHMLNDEQLNTLSIKILYYLDYLTLQKTLSGS